MAVPQGRNQKKTHRRRRIGHTVAKRRFLLDNPTDERPFSLNDPTSIRQPGSWLENEYLEQPDLGERLAGMHQDGITVPRGGFLKDYIEDEAAGEDYIDIGNDFDDLYDFE